MDVVRVTSSVALGGGKLKIKYLMPGELDALTRSFQDWFDASRDAGKQRSIRGRYWLVYLMLRFTGARLGEVVRLDDTKDIDFRAGEIRIVTLKRREDQPKRIVPVPEQVITELATFLASEPQRRGQVFTVDPSNFRKHFYLQAKEAGILSEEIDGITGRKSIHPHPHTLRHTRAIELIRSGIPITAVQNLLGHSSLLTTAEYSRLSGVEVKNLMKTNGLI
jgi:molybdate transport system regulatory protein